MGKRYPFNGFESMASGFTNDLYLPDRPLEEWSLEECRRAMCKRTNGDVTKCLECESRCKFGRRIVELLQPVEMETDLPEDEAPQQEAPQKKGRGVASAEVRMRKSRIKFLTAIASGDAEAYFRAHGMELKNNLYRIKHNYNGVTAEEARRQLAEMGVEVETQQEMPVNATETPAEQPAQVETVNPPAESEAPASPVRAPETARLQIRALDGKHFMYMRRDDGGMDILTRPVGYVETKVMTAADIDEICAEIKAAFEMMGGNTK